MVKVAGVSKHSRNAGKAVALWRWKFDAPSTQQAEETQGIAVVGNLLGVGIGVRTQGRMQVDQ